MATKLPDSTDTVIVGAGFSGIAMGAKMKRAGRHDFVILERGAEVGGTWRDNTYPGCACDVPSHVYSLSFAPNPGWSSTFSPQPEILAYLKRVAESEGLLDHIEFGTELTSAEWDEGAGRWRIETSRGPIDARAMVAAQGPFPQAKLPDVAGIESFEGTVFHSSDWNHDHDLTGERVAVVGTGASSIQFVPRIQGQVSELHLLQRTPPWIVPRTSRPLTSFEHRLYRAFPRVQKAVREAISAGREVFAVPMLKVRLSRIIRRIATKHIERQVKDPALRRALTPDYAPGCKRILISNDYYPALQKDNVDVVTSGLAEVRPNGIVTEDGREIEVDTIIFGTGFKVTEPPIAKVVKGRGEETLAELWARDGMAAHRGTTFAGFPNLFFLLGPNTGLGHNSVVLMAEAQADYAVQAIAELDRGIAAMEPRPEAQRAWNEAIAERGRGTVWVDGGCASWYLDDHGRNTTIWPDFSTRFRREVRHFDPGEYVLTPARRPEPSAVPAEKVEVAA